MQASNIATSLRDYLRILFHRKWYIIFFTCTSLAGFGVYGFLIAPKIYQADNTFLVRDVGNVEPLTVQPEVSPLVARMRDTLSEIRASDGRHSEGIYEVMAGIDEVARRYQWSKTCLKGRQGYLKGLVQEKKGEILDLDRKIEEVSKTARRATASADFKMAKDAARQEILLAGRRDDIRKQLPLVEEELRRTRRRYALVMRQKDGAGPESAVGIGDAARHEEEFLLLARATRDGLVMNHVGGSVYISAKSLEPVLSKRIVDQVFHQIKIIHQRSVANEVIGGSTTVKRQLDAAKKELAEWKRKKDELLRGNIGVGYRNVPSAVMMTQEDQDRLRGLTLDGQRLNEMVGQQQELERRIGGLENEVADLDRQLSRVSETRTATREEIDSTRKRLLERLADLQDKQVDMSVISTEDHPDFVTLLKKIAMIKRILKDTPTTGITSKTTGPNPKYTNLSERLLEKRGQLNKARGELDTMVVQVKGQREKVINNRFYREELDRIERAEKNAFQEVDKLSAKFGRVRMTERTLASGRAVEFHQPEQTEIPIAPVEPKRGLLLFLGLLIGLIFSATAVFFVEYADHSIKGIEDVRRFLGLPVLGVIPDSNIYSSSNEKRGLKFLVALNMRRVAALVVLLVAVSIGFAVLLGRGDRTQEGPWNWSNTPGAMETPAIAPSADDIALGEEDKRSKPRVKESKPQPSEESRKETEKTPERKTDEQPPKASEPDTESGPPPLSSAG